MNKLLDRYLVRNYPLIFKDRYGDVHKTNMVFGFECDDGWFNIIDGLCKEIMKVCGDNAPYATQVKEKYGTLCFYISNAPDDVHELISKAEEQSYITCEICGKKGELRNKDGWYKTLCEEDAIRFKYK